MGRARSSDSRRHSGTLGSGSPGARCPSRSCAAFRAAGHEFPAAKRFFRRTPLLTPTAPLPALTPMPTRVHRNPPADRSRDMEPADPLCFPLPAPENSHNPKPALAPRVSRGWWGTALDPSQRPSSAEADYSSRVPTGVRARSRASRRFPSVFLTGSQTIASPDPRGPARA